MLKKMAAAVVTANNMIEICDVAIPAISDNEVLVKVAYTGICGSDYGRIWNNEARYYPIILGHEFSGVVVETGSKVTKCKSGDRIAAAPLVPCLDCSYCKKGLHQQCTKYSFVGSRQNGALAQYVAVPEISIVLLNPELSLKDAAFIEPVTVGLHGLSLLSSPYLDKRIAILGVGGIGLLTMQSLLSLGAKNVTALDISDERLQIAEDLGAHQRVNTKNYPEEKLLKKFDVVIETAGNVFTTKQAFKLADARGEILLIGTPHSDISFSFDEWELINRKELTVKGSWMNYSAPYPGEEWVKALDFFRNGKINTGCIVGSEIPLNELPETLTKIKNGQVSGKILVSIDSNLR